MANDQYKPKVTPETNDKEPVTTDKRAKFNKWAGIGSTVANITTQQMQADKDAANEGKMYEQYYNQNEGQGQGIASTVASIHPIAGLAVAAGGMIGTAIEDDTRNEYGAYTGANSKERMMGSSGFAPWRMYDKKKQQEDLLTDDEKNEFFNKNEWAGAFLTFGAGEQVTKNANAIAGRMETFDKANTKNKDAYEAAQKRINDGEYSYAKAMSNAYSGISAAKRGAIISFKAYKRKRIEISKSEVSHIKPIASFKGGGKAKLSIIPEGAFHHTDNKLGDKGIPVVDVNGVKVFEIEKVELILNKDVSDRALFLTEKYNKTGNEEYLSEIGSIVSDELKDNTYSYADEYSCLNNNTCTL